MSALRRILPTSVAMAVGILVLVALFTTNPLLDGIGAYLVSLTVIVAAFALFLGVLNVLRVHARRVREGHKGRFYSFVLLAAMLLVIALGLPPVPNQPSGPSQPAVAWIFQNVQLPIQASFSALLVFFLVTATLRLLTVRNLESAVMLLVVLLVLAGQVTVGLAPLLPEIRDWILNVPAIAGVRGILLGVALGAVLTGVRLLLGVERPYGD
ncbi:MAG TPA: hypothetical protein VLC52_03975 [Anaerolineae bacterium]|nr:hypothetical protein [Anaerolineae bacterium]